MAALHVYKARPAQITDSGLVFIVPIKKCHANSAIGAPLLMKAVKQNAANIN